MGDSGPCLMHAFSYTSGMPNQAQQGNPMNALGESISFGRFMSESLSWEKWSTFSQNKYVEEAERYARPGSVAQKKAFFEAHYKRIAAQKAAAALVEQENNNNNDAAKSSSEPESETMVLSSSEEAVVEPEVKKTEQPESDVSTVKYDCEKVSQVKKSDEQTAAAGGEVVESDVPADPLQDTASVSEVSGTSQMEKPLLKGNWSEFLQEQVASVKSKKKSAFASLKSSVYGRTSVNKNPTKTVDLIEKKRSTTQKKSLPSKEPDKVVITGRKKESSKVSQDCATPLRTPNMAKESQYYATPCGESSRPKSPNCGSKSTGPKWHILSAVCSKSLTACRSKLQSPTLSTPFILRTEERAARRKQKLEEKFNSKELEVQKVQLQTTLKEKAESELRKLRQSFCFKARPLPDFYKKGGTTKVQKKKSSVTPQYDDSAKPSSSTAVSKNNSKHVSSSSTRNPQKTPSFFPSVPETVIINHENKSPNILY